MKGRLGRQEAIWVRYELLARIEEAAKRLGVSKSSLYRQAVLDYLLKIERRSD